MRHAQKPLYEVRELGGGREAAAATSRWEVLDDEHRCAEIAKFAPGAAQSQHLYVSQQRLYRVTRTDRLLETEIPLPGQAPPPGGSAA